MTDETYLTVDGEQYDITHEQLRRVIEADLPFSHRAQQVLEKDDRISSESEPDD